mgnify:CR=1 FL=1
MSEHGDILDFDQIGEENILKSEETNNQGDDSATKNKNKKKQARKSQANKPINAAYQQILYGSTLEKPKMSREEMKNLQAMLLFQKLEQVPLDLHFFDSM